MNFVFRYKLILIYIKMDVENTAVNVVEKRKKGRPRKIIVEGENTNTNDKSAAPEIKIKKKRGRKAALKYFSSSIRKQIPLTTNIVDNENEILCFDIKESENVFTRDNNILSFDDNDNEMLASFNCTNNDNINENFDNQTDDTSDNLLVENFNNMCINNTKDKNDELLNQIEIQKDNIKKGYFQLFNNYNVWNEHSDVKCWWCCHHFTSLPIGMPVQYIHDIQKFAVRGIFCSFACMLVYFNTTKNKINKKYLINFLYKKLTGFNKLLFKEAPPRYVLKEFGGTLTIEQFRNLSTELKSYKMVEYPMFMSRDYIAEVDLATIKQVNNKVFNNNQKIIVLDDKKVEEAKTRILKTETNVNMNNTIENFIKN